MAERNPTWNRDELILALDLYVRFRGNPPGKQSPEIRDLSDFLGRMGRHLARPDGTFRNPNGVYMKLMNFRRLDPAYRERGRRGLRGGGQEEKPIWEEYARDPEHLRAVAVAIREAVDAGEAPEASPGEDEETAEAVEGRILTGMHRQRERSRKLVDRKKAQALRESGRLACEACGFDFAAVYGERGRGFIEAHHTRPLHTLRPGVRTKLGDLALLCSNCHRMVHARQPWITASELRRLTGRP